MSKSGNVPRVCSFKSIEHACFQSCYIYFPTSILKVAIASLILDIDKYFKNFVIMVVVNLSPLNFLSTKEVSLIYTSFEFLFLLHVYPSLSAFLYLAIVLRILKTLSFTYVQNPYGICFYLWHNLVILFSFY